jgi:hypothetical protein
MPSEVRSMSVLNRPQKDWDDFLDGRSASGRFSTIKKLLWVIVPAGVLAAIILYRYFGV